MLRILHIISKAITVRSHLRNIRGRTVHIRPFTRAGEKAKKLSRFIIGEGRKAVPKVGKVYEYKTAAMARPAKLRVVGIKGKKVEVEFATQQRAEKPRRFLIPTERFRAVAVKKEKPAHPPVAREGELLKEWEGAIIVRAKRAAIRYQIPIEFHKGRPAGSFEDLVQSLREEFVKSLRRETARGIKHHTPVESALYVLKERAHRFAAQLSKEIGIPRRVIKRLSHIARVERGLESELGRHATTRELYQRIAEQEKAKSEGKKWEWNAPGDVPKSMTFEDFGHAREELQTRMSLDPAMLEELEVPHEYIESPEETARKNILKQRIYHVVGEKLGPKEREVLAGVHGFGYEFKELAEKMNMPEERVEAIHDHAVKKLRRDKVSMRRLAAYLKSVGEPLLGMTLRKALRAVFGSGGGCCRKSLSAHKQRRN